MGDIFFFIKMIIMTFIFIVFLQIKIGDHTLEERAKIAITESALIVPLQEVAQGGVKVIQVSWRKMTELVGHKVKESFDRSNMPGQRTLGLGIERSEAFLKEQLQKAKQKAERSKTFKEIKNQKDHLEDGLIEELKEEGFYVDES